MKMKILITTSMMMMAVQTQAAVNLVIRSDYYNNAKSTDTSNNDVQGVSVLAPTVARLDASTSVGDAKVYLGLNLRSFDTATSTSIGGGSATGTVKRVMTVDKFVENLYIAKPLGDFTFSAGKLEMNAGGFERAKIVSGDTYMASLANGSTMGLVTFAGTATTVIYNPENQSGVELDYAFNPEHKLALQVSNETNSAEASASGTTAGAPTITKSTNKRNTIGAQYEGSFADKMAEVMLQYTAGVSDTYSQASTGGTMSSTSTNQKYLSAGLKFNLPSDLVTTIEYFSNTSLSDTTAAKSDVTTSTTASIRYNHGMYQPILLLESSENKLAEDSATTGSFKRTAYSAALEIVPKSEEAFRYHVAYNGFSDKYGKAGLLNDTVTNSQIIVGLKYTGDLLK
jgi:hypothetical protein